METNASQKKEQKDMKQCTIFYFLKIIKEELLKLTSNTKSAL